MNWCERRRRILGERPAGGLEHGVPRDWPKPAFGSGVLKGIVEADETYMLESRESHAIKLGRQGRRQRAAWRRSAGLSRDRCRFSMSVSTATAARWTNRIKERCCSSSSMTAPGAHRWPPSIRLLVARPTPCSTRSATASRARARPAPPSAQAFEDRRRDRRNQGRWCASTCRRRAGPLPPADGRITPPRPGPVSFPTARAVPARYPELILSWFRHRLSHPAWPRP